MLNFVLDTQMPSAETYLSFLPLILLIVLFYFLLIRPQKKRDKADKEMRNSLVTGDRICTIGGIVGKIVQVNDDEIVMETSGNRMRFKKWAVRGKIDGTDSENN